MPLKVTTNNHVRPILDGSQLTETERADFDYVDWQAVERGEESATFVRYRGDLIHLEDVEVATHPLKAQGFDGMVSTSFFDGLAFRYFDAEGNLLDSGDGIVVGHFYASED